jgi:hypothetical protein
MMSEPSANPQTTSRSRKLLAALRVRERVQKSPILSSVLLLGFLLRLITIQWGVPIDSFSGYYHADEAKTWISTVGFPQCYLSSKMFLYGTAIQYGVGVLLLPVKLVMVGILSKPFEYCRVAVLFFRFCNLMMGMGAIYLAYLLARRLFDRRVGLICAAFLSVSLYHCLSSALTTLDVPMSFLVLLLLHQLLRAQEAPSLRSYLVFGLVAGILLATKITGGLFLACGLCYLVVAELLSGAERRLSPAKQLGLAFLSAVVAGFVLILTTPQIALDLSGYLEFMAQQKLNWYDRVSEGTGVMMHWATARAVGWPVEIAAALGLVPFLRSRPRGWLPVALFIVANYAFWQSYLMPRFVIPVAPLLCILAAVLWGTLLGHRRAPARYLGGLGVALTIGASLLACCTGAAHRLFDTRTAAAHYIADAVPRGATIGIALDHNKEAGHHFWRYPRLVSPDHRENSFLERPEYLIVTSFELETMVPALQSPALRPGYRWDPSQINGWYLHEPPAPEIFRFFDELLSGSTYVPLFNFEPVIRLESDFAPPTIHLYRRRDARSGQVISGVPR